MVNKNSFDFPVFTLEGNDHGVVIMRVDVSCIFLREGDRGFWSLELALCLNFREVLYTQDLDSVPSSGGAGFLAPRRILLLWC